LATPREQDVIRQAIEEFSRGLTVSVLAVVQSYDPVTQTCSVKPIAGQVLSDGRIVSVPVIADVPVLFPGGGGFAIVWTPMAGDEVDLLIASHSIDDWMNSPVLAVDIPPVSDRRQKLTDAVAIPGIRPKTRPRASGVTAGTDLVLGLESGVTEIRVKATTIQLGSATAASPLALAPLVEGYLTQVDVQLKAMGLPGLTPSPITVSSTRLMGE